MRVIGGKFRSRRLKFPRTKEIRPATDRLKETIFDILGQDLSGLDVLDLYAGMGSLGIEALSRGARHVTFVDHLSLGVRYIRENLQSLGLIQQAEILKMEAHEAIPYLSNQGRIYQVAFIDPPYNKGLVKKTLLGLEQFDILAPQATIAIEHARQEEPPSMTRFVLTRTNRYGITCLSFLHTRAS